MREKRWLVKLFKKKSWLTRSVERDQENVTTLTRVRVKTTASNMQRLDSLKSLTTPRLKWWTFLKKMNNNWEWWGDLKKRSLWCRSSKNKSTWCNKSVSKKCWCSSNKNKRNKKCLSNSSRIKRCSCSNSRMKRLWDWQDKGEVESERIVAVELEIAVEVEIKKPITLNSNISNKRVKKWELLDQMLDLKAPSKSFKDRAHQTCLISNSNSNSREWDKDHQMVRPIRDNKTLKWPLKASTSATAPVWEETKLLRKACKWLRTQESIIILCEEL